MSLYNNMKKGRKVEGRWHPPWHVLCNDMTSEIN